MDPYDSDSSDGGPEFLLQSTIPKPPLSTIPIMRRISAATEWIGGAISGASSGLRRIRVRGTSHTNRYSKNLKDGRASYGRASHEHASHRRASHRRASHRPVSHRPTSHKACIS